MNYGILLFWLLFLTVLIQAQPLVQNGLVREQNSGKQPVADVQVIYEGAVPSSSDQGGKFRLVFQDKKPGDFVFLTEVRKSGYELVNNKEVEQLKLSNSEQLGRDIILAKAGVLAAAKKEYYEISDAALLESFESEKRKLREALSQAELTQQQYSEQYEALLNQYETQKGELDRLAEKFARVNFDDVSPLYEEALQLFKAGKIDQAIQKLESADLLTRTGQRLQERARINQAEKEIAEQKAANEKGIKEDLQALRLQAELYVLTFEVPKAEALYDRMLLLDSTDLAILQEAADFYRENHRYEKALRLYPKIITHPEAEAWQRANAYGHIGDLFTTTGNLSEALQTYHKAHEQYASLSNEDPGSSFYKNNLAISYERLGETHNALGDLNQALGFYEDETDLFKELYEAYPNNVSFKNGLAASYQFLGNTHRSLGHLKQALGFYEECNRLEKELYETYPNNVAFKNGLAISYSKLGVTHSALGDLNQALGFYEEFSRLEKELYETYPNNVAFKNGLAISYQYLGNTRTALGDLNKALGLYEEYNRLEKELYEAYPNNVEFKNNLAISYEKLGETHSALGDLNKALGFYEKDLELTKELYETYPNNVSFKNGLAISYEKLGSTHTALGHLDQALVLFEEYNRLEKELYETYPNNVGFKNGLALSYQWLGWAYEKVDNRTKAMEYYKLSAELLAQLVESFPGYVEFKRNLEWVQNKLSEK